MKRSARKRGDPEEGAMASLPAGQSRQEDRDEEISEKKASGKKKKTTKRTSQSSSKNLKEKSPDIQITKNGTGPPTSTTLHVDTKEDICSTPVCTTTGVPSGEVWINIVASHTTSPPSSSSTSATSEPPVCLPNETLQTTPVKSCSAESLSTLPNSSTSESDMLTCSKEPSTPPLETADDLTLPDETGSTPTIAKSTIVTITSETVLSSSTPAIDLLSSSKDSEEKTNAVALETSTTNSSTESCKTPVAPSSDVVITVEDDDMLKSPLLISENESSSAEMIYAREESTTETKVDADETNVPCSEVLKTNDGDGAQCENDEVPIDEGRQLVKIYFNAVPADSHSRKIIIEENKFTL